MSFGKCAKIRFGGQGWNFYEDLLFIIEVEETTLNYEVGGEDKCYRCDDLSNLK